MWMAAGGTREELQDQIRLQINTPSPTRQTMSRMNKPSELQEGCVMMKLDAKYLLVPEGTCRTDPHPIATGKILRAR